MTDHSIDSYIYETKCRRCSSLNEFYYSDKATIPFMDFATAMTDHLNNPRQRDCETCGKPTVQDVVSYTDN